MNHTFPSLKVMGECDFRFDPVFIFVDFKIEFEPEGIFGPTYKTEVIINEIGHNHYIPHFLRNVKYLTLGNVGTIILI